MPACPSRASAQGALFSLCPNHKYHMVIIAPTFHPLHTHEIDNFNKILADSKSTIYTNKKKKYLHKAPVKS